MIDRQLAANKGLQIIHEAIDVAELGVLEWAFAITEPIAPTAKPAASPQ